MAKAAKKEKPQSNRPDHYEDRLVVNGTFMDIIKAAVKHRANNVAKNKKP